MQGSDGGGGGGDWEAVESNSTAAAMTETSVKMDESRQTGESPDLVARPTCGSSSSFTPFSSGSLEMEGVRRYSLWKSPYSLVFFG